jgi:micrococcal nuclease
MSSREMDHEPTLRMCLSTLASCAVADDPPKPFTGKVVKVTDGDTIHVLLDKETHKIRLLHIDAPESKQAFSTKAKQALSEMVFGKDVKVVWKARIATSASCSAVGVP